MVNWQDPQVLALCSTISDRISVFSLGVYCWYLLTTLSYVEIPLLRRQLEWRWGYLCYLCGRYSALISRVAALFPPGITMIRVMTITGGIAIICSTGNLLTRTLVLWQDTPRVVYMLLCAEAGHWAFAIAELWVPVIRDTLASPANQNIFYRSHLFVYCYTFLIDSTVLVLTIWGLYHRELRPADKLWHMLYRQGIVYFVATLLVNVPLVVFDELSLNVFMTIMFIGPSAVVGVMASSQALLAMYRMAPQEPCNYAFTETLPGPNGFGMVNATSQGGMARHLHVSYSLHPDERRNSTHSNSPLYAKSDTVDPETRG